MQNFCTILCALLLTLPLMVNAQIEGDRPVFSRKDSLRGSLTPSRTCYDITYYHLDVAVDPEKRTIEGSNTIYFDIVETTQELQVDLFANMWVSKITLNGKTKLKFRREYDAVFVELPQKIAPYGGNNIRIDYGGTPIVAKRPPWDGGITWEKDSVGNPWIAVTCQGTGASLWWPNKDHQSDEPDSMLISISVPEGLENVSNGRLRSVTELKNGWKKYDWFVSYPINNYNVTFNIGKFAHISDWYVSKEGDSLSLDYYVLPQELDKAKRQFAQVHPMMDFFYKYFGPYPFVRDGYKLVQSPHLGMEHQSAVAYGNGYLNGYAGIASSEVGLTFDFIILHETAHEWWGNSITSNDIADMWVHESFGAYSEALYVEFVHGYDAAMKYINGKKQNVQNDKPIVGPFGVGTSGSSDMYDKGQLALNTLRHVIDDDELWKSILLGLNEEFSYQTIDGSQVFEYINKATGTDLSYFFGQYFRHAALPELRVNIVKKGDEVTLYYRWVADAGDFRMPIKVTTSPGRFETIHPTTNIQLMEISGLHPDEFRIAEDQYFVDLNIRKTYSDPRK